LSITIRRAVKKFFKRVKKHIKHESFIFDVVVFHDMTIKIVELNPFGEHTGVAMFSWKEDADVIKGPNQKESPLVSLMVVSSLFHFPAGGPFEFRIRTEPAPEAHLKAILGTWSHLVTMATKTHENDDSKDASHGQKGDKCILC
jgi:hypothetical protein